MRKTLNFMREFIIEYITETIPIIIFIGKAFCVVIAIILFFIFYEMGQQAL